MPRYESSWTSRSQAEKERDLTTRRSSCLKLKRPKGQERNPGKAGRLWSARR